MHSRAALLQLVAAAAGAVAWTAPPAPLTNQTNLPPATPGVFASSARAAIAADADAVFAAVLDFAAYPDWNPFVRCVRASVSRACGSRVRACSSAVLADAAFVPLPADEQTVAENKRAIFVVQIPPLAGPISAGTPPDPLNTQVSLENVTHLEPAARRVAWAYAAVPALAISAERWSAVSVIADGPQAGLALYESREVYAGALAPAVEALYGTGLQEAYDAQAAALKQLLEG
jgi:hypothetical protein